MQSEMSEKRMCRHLSRRQMSWKELFPRITIISDPKKLAELGAELKRQNLRLLEIDRQRGLESQWRKK
jgi:hypothetical protein